MSLTKNAADMPEDRTRAETDDDPPVQPEVARPTAQQELIPAEFKAVLEDVPADARGKIISFFMGFRSGPLPHPNELAGYEAVVPGAAKQIITMAEASATHRRSIETKVTDASIADTVAERKERSTGQLYGLIIGVTSIIAGSVTASLGSPISGSIIGTAGVTGLVSAFIIGRHQENTGKGKDSETAST